MEMHRHASGVKLTGKMINRYWIAYSSCPVPPPSCQDEGIEYEPDAKEFLQHVDKVVFVRRIPSWVSSEELGRQVPFPALSVPHSVCK